MITFTPFRAGHLEFLTPQPAQAREHAALVSAGGASMLEQYVSLSAWDGLTCIGCAGLIPIRPHRAMAWALLGGRLGPHMGEVVRKIRRVVAAAPYRRVEFTVAEGFNNGHRFARALGATLETPEPMQGYGAFGNAEFMYAIVRKPNG